MKLISICFICNLIAIMKNFKLSLNLAKISMLLILGGQTALAAEPSPVLIGKDNWLFTPYEFATASDATDTQATIQLFEKVNKVFDRKGIKLALVIVPSKVRIHEDKLPSDRPLDKYTSEKYENIVKALQTAGVSVVNLNRAFLGSTHRISDTPLFLRLDTHWSPSGAFVAAETIKSHIDGDAGLKAAYASTKEENYTIAWAAKKTTTRARDLVRLLPKDAPTYPAEQTLPFKVTRTQTSQAGLLSGADNVGITVIGSSYTNKNTGYPDGLRYTLQRDILDLSIPVDQGPWFGMDSYLRDDAFKTNKPKLIIWEIPEREFRSPPSNKFRDPRYIIDNNEWLSRVTELLK
jgi:alginate O-acetyltransferase complex protein AlgJ